MKPAQRVIECISYRDFKKLVVRNLPDSISEAVVVIVEEVLPP